MHFASVAAPIVCNSSVLSSTGDQLECAKYPIRNLADRKPSIDLHDVDCCSLPHAGLLERGTDVQPAAEGQFAMVAIYLNVRLRFYPEAYACIL